MSVELPTDKAAELGVIACCITGGLETALTALNDLRPEAFFHDMHRTALKCVETLAQAGQTPDLVNLEQEWRRVHGSKATLPPEITQAVADLPSPANLKAYVASLIECAERRNAIQAGDFLMTGAADARKPLPETIAEAQNLLNPAYLYRVNITEPRTIAENLQADLEFRHGLGGKRSGYASGFPGFDRMTDGLQPAELWVIAARPGKGKTALAINVASWTAFNEKIPTLFVSLEMTGVAISRRILSASAGIPLADIRRGRFTEADFKKMVAFQAKLLGSPFYILDSPGGIKCSRLVASLRASIKRWGIKVLFVDYLQKIRGDTPEEKRTYEIQQVTGALVDLTKREGVHTFALAQLNRESEKQKGRAPILCDLADSKAIEADADLVGLIHRDEEDDNAQLIIAKQRDGPLGLVDLKFEREFTRFVEKPFTPPPVPYAKDA